MSEKYQAYAKHIKADSFLLTRKIFYPTGAWIASLLSPLGIKPNTITILSGASAIGTTLYVIRDSTSHSCLYAALLLLGLFLSYALDCTDGLVARVHKQGTPFGALFDKIMDATVILLPAFLLFFASRHNGDIPPLWKAIIGGTFLTIRMNFCLLFWMKELLMTKNSEKKSTALEKKRPLILEIFGNYLESPFISLLFALGWATGYLWEIIALYTTGLLPMFLLYLQKTKKELNAS